MGMKFSLESASNEEKDAVLSMAQQNQQQPQQQQHVNVVFCIPGREFTANFLKSWTNLMGALNANNITFALMNSYSPVVYYARSACLGMSVLNGKKQKPFNNGQLTYDYIMWIDSDIVFTPQHFFRLLERMIKNPQMRMLSGLYKMADNYHTTCVDEWDEEYFINHGSFRFLTLEDCQKKKELHKNTDGIFKCVYIGFGFLLIRSGVFEEFDYPVFYPQFHTLKGKDGKEVYDFSSEDASFFLDCYHKKKIDCFVDPDVVVGHEKMVVLA